MGLTAGRESGGEAGGDDSDTDWNMTVKGLPTQSYNDSLGYSDPINSVSDIISNGVSDVSLGSISPVKDVSRDISPVKEVQDREDHRARSPIKEVSRARSPEKTNYPYRALPGKK